jgi:hypothetical protein
MPKISRDLVSGGLFAAIGGAAIVVASDYPMGSATKMGPGYFPAVVGMVLVGLGAIKVLRALVWQHGGGIERLATRPLLLIPGAVIVFGLLLLRAGLVPAILALVVLACVSRPRAKIIETLVIFAAAALIASTLWIYGLGFPAQSLF